MTGRPRLHRSGGGFTKVGYIERGPGAAPLAWVWGRASLGTCIPPSFSPLRRLRRRVEKTYRCKA
jgi:hypothetical protein